jgi:probable phosphoglycerate mutase
MTDFLLIRHGETDWNRELRFQGHIDVPLNDIGLQQAQRLQQRVTQRLSQWQQEQRVPTRVVTSDLLRAQQTAQPVAQALGVQLQVSSGLREQCYGCFEGLKAVEIKQKFPDEWQQWLRFDPAYAVPDAECLQDFYHRVVTTLHELAHTYQGEHMVVVTHGGVLDMIWRHAKAQSLHGPRACDIPNAGLNQVRWQAGALHIQHWADTEHLVGMPPQPVYRTTELKNI